TLAGHDGQVLRVQYSPDGKYMATEGEDGLVKLWDPANGKNLWSLPAATACFSSDSRWLLTAANQQPITQWEVATRKQVKTLDEPNRPLQPRLVAARKAPVVACLDGPGAKQALYVWRLGEPKPTRLAVQLAGGPPVSPRGVIDIALSPD